MLPEKVHFLGFSAALLAQTFESLKSQQFEGEVFIWLNVPVSENVPYDCGIKHQIATIDQFPELLEGQCIFAVVKPSIKQAIFKDFADQKNLQESSYFNLWHKNTTIASTSTLAAGIYLEPGVIISPFAKIGFGVNISRGTSIGHHTTIDSFSSVNPGVTIAGHCHIEEASSIGAGSTIFDHITIGKNSIIGGGSVVTKDVPSNVIAYGNPCRIIRQI